MQETTVIAIITVIGVILLFGIVYFTIKTMFNTFKNSRDKEDK